MGLERVGGDTRIVTPDLFEKHIAGDDLLVGAVEIADDRGFLLGQPDLAALVVEQQFLARLEGVGTDGEGGGRAFRESERRG